MLALLVLFYIIFVEYLCTSGAVNPLQVQVVARLGGRRSLINLKLSFDRISFVAKQKKTHSTTLALVRVTASVWL